MFNEILALALNVSFSPENQSFSVLLRIALRRVEFYTYHAVILAWVTASIFFPSYYFSLTLGLIAILIFHPTRLFRLARRRASAPRTKDTLTVLQFSWISFVMVAFLFLAFGAGPPTFGISMPFAWEIAFLSTSTMFFLMSNAVTNPSRLTRIWASFVPGTVVKLGQRYLILHDAGERARSLLSASLSALIEAGVRVVVTDPVHSSLINSALSMDNRFERWETEGRLVKIEAVSKKSSLKEKESGFPHLRTVGTVYVVEVLDGKLDKVTSILEHAKKLPNTTGLYLVDKGKVVRRELTQLLQSSKDVRLLDLSTLKAPFSAALNVSHSKLQGKTILLEYASGSNHDESVERFLAEGVSHGELCAVFTSKSTRLYRSIKENKKVKIVGVSSLAFEHIELPDGEIQIPDEDLGIVTSILSDLIETAEGTPACFVLDNLTELVGGNGWELVFSGIKQIVELVSLPNVTTIVLANRDILEHDLLAALPSIFQIHLRLDNTGLREANPTIDPANAGTLASG